MLNNKEGLEKLESWIGLSETSRICSKDGLFTAEGRITIKHFKYEDVFEKECIIQQIQDISVENPLHPPRHFQVHFYDRMDENNQPINEKILFYNVDHCYCKISRC